MTGVDSHGTPADASRRVRVLHLVLQLATGGAESMVTLLAAHANRSRFDVHVWGIDTGGEKVAALQAAGVPVRVLAKGTGFRPAFLRAFRRLLVEGRFDIVHAHNPPAARWALAGTVGLRPAPIRVRTEHTFHPDRRLATALGHAATGAWFRAVVGVSEHTSRSHRRLDPVWRRRHRAIPNGVPMDLALPTRAEARSTLQSLGVPPSARIIVNLGNLRPPKGQSFLVEAVARITERFPDAHTVFLGEGPLRRDLEQQAAQRDLLGRVHFPGHRSDADLLLAGADLFVQSSVREGMPVSVIEAARASCPIVATDVGGTREVVEDGSSARIVPAADPERLAEAMTEMLSDPSAAARFGRAARRRAESLFDIRRIAATTEALYAELLERR